MHCDWEGSDCVGDCGDDQGVTNVSAGKIFLKQFPADTAQWDGSLLFVLVFNCCHRVLAGRVGIW